MQKRAAGAKELGGVLGWILKRPAVSRWTTMLGEGAGNTLFWDAMYNEGVPVAGEWDTARSRTAALNFLVGLYGGSRAHKGLTGTARAKRIELNPKGKGGVLTKTQTHEIEGLHDAAGNDYGVAVATVPGSVAKDLMTLAYEEGGKINSNIQEHAGAVKSLADAIKEHSSSTEVNIAPQEASSWDKYGPWIAGIGGLGALGIGALALSKYLRSKDEKQTAKIKLKLPGSPDDPNTAAEFEMPVDIPDISNAMMGDMKTIAKRQARKNIRANKRKQDPFSNKLIPVDMWEDKYGEEPLYDEVDQWRDEVEEKYGKKVKYASAAPLPTPPGTVQNPPPPPSQQPQQAPPPPPQTPPGGMPMTRPANGAPPAAKSTEFASVDTDNIIRDIRVAGKKNQILEGVYDKLRQMGSIPSA